MIISSSIYFEPAPGVHTPIPNRRMPPPFPGERPIPDLDIDDEKPPAIRRGPPRRDRSRIPGTPTTPQRIPGLN